MPICRSLLSALSIAALAVFRAAAQPVLLHGAGAEPREIASVNTYAGPAKASLTPVEPSDQIVVAVLADTVAAGQQDRVRSQILTFYQDAGTAGPAKKMLLAVLQGQELTKLGPFHTRASLQIALRKLWSGAADQAPAAPATIYQLLVNSAGELGSNWSSVVLIGSLPEVEAPLRDYAAAYLANRLAAQRLRTSYWNPDGSEPGWFTEVCQATGGVSLSAGLEPLSDLLIEPKSSSAEVTWQLAAPVRGFLMYRAKLVTPAGAAAGDFPAIAIHPGMELPDLTRYAELRQHVESARKLESEAQPTQEQAGQIRAELEAAMRINPSDPDALRLGADFYARFKDYATAAQLLEILAEGQPTDAALLAELGHAHFAAQQFPEAEKALLRARELGGGDARQAEELARIHIARQDDAGALPFIEESLAKQAGSQPLWYLRADVAARLKDWNKQAASLERGIAQGGDTLERRTSLVRLYLDHQAGGQALPHIEAVVAALPKDAKVGRTYAEFLDELHRSADALAVWKKVLELDPTLEPAHFRVTRLLIEKGSLPDALTSADAGLAAAPKSARLYVAKSEILEKQGAFYESRDVLRKAASLDDPELLARLSELEDISGSAAARSYLHLAESLEKASPLSPEYVRALQRGLETALRDNDAETAAKCAAKLRAAGQKTFDTAAQARQDQTKGAPVPGGLETLAFIAHSKPKSPPERFFVEYAKAVRLNTKQNDKPGKLYIEAIEQHFQLVSTLEAMGTRNGDTVKFHLSLEDKKAQKQTEKILNLLGWKLRTSKNGTTLDAGEKAGQAKRQETTSALAIDEAGMQEALEARKSFDFEIRDEPAPVVLGEDAWRKAFYPKENLAGGFAEAMARDLKMAELYAGLCVMDKDALAALLPGTDLKTLAGKYGNLIFWYSPALALHQDRVAVPGGSSAEPIWDKIAGASPAHPAQFFRALLDKDDGKLLSFYATLAQLDLAHQRFFTRNASRTSKFYELFRQSAEVAVGAGRETNRTTFFEFLREVPLDEQGNVDFPGSPELWMVAKGQASASAMASHLKKVSKVAAPDEEDEVLLRLARTHYKSSQSSFSELDNFVAVARIDAHRSDPLDDASALLLADQFSENRGAYPYFACLTGMTRAALQSFFNMSAKLKGLPEVEMNTVLGEFHAIAQLLCLAQESGALDRTRAAEMFGQLAEQFGQAASPADFASASLDALRKMLPTGSTAPDEAIRTLLLGRSAPVAFDLDGASYQTDWIARRDTDFRHVLELQKVTPLGTLYLLYDAARDLIANRGDASEKIRILETASAALPVVEVPKTMHLKGKLHEDLQAFQKPAAAAEIAKLRQKTGKGKVNRKDIEKLCHELLADINPQVRIALTGILYAYYFRPSDLLVSEDPLFLRKHQFVELSSGVRPSPFRDPSELEVSSEDAGSYLKGGFAAFSRVAGQVAASGPHRGGNSDMVFAAQIGSLRATDWRSIGDHAVLIFGLKVRLAREWIERASRSPELLSDLADGALGVLSLSRRAGLLNALRAGDWQAVWQSVTLSDLYFLSDSYMTRYQADPWESPVTRYLRRMSNDAGAAQLASMGASHPYLNGCDHPHLTRLAPYEEYERVLMPTAMAERVSEFKLYLLEYAGEAGIPAAALGAVAEPVALDVMRKMQMADTKDWRPVALAYASLGELNIRAALTN